MGKIVSLAEAFTKKPSFAAFRFWIVGDTPLITHAWSEKARREMLSKQVKAPKAGKDAKDPEADFVASLYEMDKGVYGFPVTGIKNCILTAAHKDKGIARTDVMAALFLNGEMTRTRPALAGAVCDVPLVRIWGDAPVMREDMVRVGKGLNKVAALAYRGQFTVWAIRVEGRYNTAVLNPEQLGFLVQEAGMANGLGEWRNEKKGMFGAFHLGTRDEEKEWDRYSSGKGKIPTPAAYAEAAE